jgi:mRNA interferase MazF
LVSELEPTQGEIWWGESSREKGRPFLVWTRNEAIPVLRAILVAPVTRTVRGIPTEVVLGRRDGLDVDCVATIDNTLAFPKAMLVRRMGALSPGRFDLDVCASIRAALAC